MYLRVMPLTGRMHQIRVHFASLGCPLVSGPHFGKVNKQQNKVHIRPSQFIGNLKIFKTPPTLASS